MSENTLTLGRNENSLIVEVTPVEQTPRVFTVTFQVKAWPFAATLRGQMSDDALADLRAEFRSEPLPRELHLGGERSIELVLKIDEPFGANPALLGMSATLSRTGDDPYPPITWLLSDMPPSFALDAASAIDRAPGERNLRNPITPPICSAAAHSAAPSSRRGPGSQ